jgi:tight adherence protein B
MGTLLVCLLVFLIGAGAVLAVFAAVTWLPGVLLRRRVEARLLDVGTFDEVIPEATIIKRENRGPLPVFDRLAIRTSSGSALVRFIEQSGTRLSPSGLLMLSIVGGLVVSLLASVIVRAAWTPLVGLVLGLSVPFLVLAAKRKARIRKFEELFPEALELVSRSIRAGHAFTTALGTVAQECPDPVGPEFRKTFDQQNYGLPLKDALNAMADRIPLLDVRFFATAVLIQRETGGNLAEILDNLAHVVRERFKILRQVRVHTAHGRYTGYVLMALPPVLAIALSFINPEHMDLLFREPMGHKMIMAAIGLQVMGYLWIKQVVKIEV